MIGLMRLQYRLRIRLDWTWKYLGFSWKVINVIVNKGYAKEIITFDGAEPKSIDHLKKLGLYRVRAARKGKDSILNGIDFIQQFQIIQLMLKLSNFST